MEVRLHPASSLNHYKDFSRKGMNTDEFTYAFSHSLKCRQLALFSTIEQYSTYPIEMNCIFMLENELFHKDKIFFFAERHKKLFLLLYLIREFLRRQYLKYLSR